jgi:hypothetical protein
MRTALVFALFLAVACLGSPAAVSHVKDEAGGAVSGCGPGDRFERPAADGVAGRTLACHRPAICAHRPRGRACRATQSVPANREIDVTAHREFVRTVTVTPTRNEAAR